MMETSVISATPLSARTSVKILHLVHSLILSVMGILCLPLHLLSTIHGGLHLRGSLYMNMPKSGSMCIYFITNMCVCVGFLIDSHAWHSAAYSI